MLTRSHCRATQQHTLRIRRPRTRRFHRIQPLRLDVGPQGPTGPIPVDRISTLKRIPRRHELLRTSILLPATSQLRPHPHASILPCVERVIPSEPSVSRRVIKGHSRLGPAAYSTARCPLQVAGQPVSPHGFDTQSVTFLHASLWVIKRCTLVSSRVSFFFSWFSKSQSGVVGALTARLSVTEG